MDLAQVDPRGTKLPSLTANRETTMPRIDTSKPALEINAPIVRPDQSGAEQLQRILGLANDVGQNIAGDIAANKNKDAAAAGASDFSAGTKNDKQFQRTRAYRESWQLQSAKSLAINIGTEATQWVNDRLNDSDHPATLDEINHGLEGIYQKHVLDASGKPLDFGPPEAKMALANALQEVRSNILPQAQAAIKKQTDATLLTTWASNNVHEFYRGGVAIGSPVGARGPITPGDEPIGETIPDTSRPYYPVTRTVYSNAGGAKPTAPFSGFGTMKPTSVMGAPREGGSVHNGEDFPVPLGTPLVAPMQGTVVAAFTNARGGNQVRLKMADGATVGFAHLSKLDVKQGDAIPAGAQLGLSGATGHATGPHVHMTVEVGGKKVSPTAYFKGASVPSGLPSGPAYVSTGTEPVLATAPVGPPQALPPFNMEAALAQVPPSISKTEAKHFLVQSLINEANSRGDIGLLRGLEDSQRRDGTPSLTPDEVATVQQAREVISDRVRVQGNQARTDMWEKNGNSVINAFLSPNPPSIGWLRSQAHNGSINPELAYSMENHIEAQAREDAATARSEARTARAEADAGYDADVVGMASLREAGQVGDASPDADLALLKSGKLGQGKRALMRFNQLRAAAKQGEEINLRNPEVGVYAGKLHDAFGKTQTGFLEKAMQGGQINYTGIVSYYKDKVMKGESPAQAYFDVVQKFAPKSKAASQARDERIQQLRAQRLMGQ